jgi:hypothetical protein
MLHEYIRSTGDTAFLDGCRRFPPQIMRPFCDISAEFEA